VGRAEPRHSQEEDVKDWAVKQIPYQRTGRRRPEILSPQEVAALFRATPE